MVVAATFMMIEYQYFGRPRADFSIIHYYYYYYLRRRQHSLAQVWGRILA
jgi:hypothetical protein